MKKRSFFWHIFPLFLIISLAPCALILVYTINEIRKFYSEQTRMELVKRSLLAQQYILENLDKPDKIVDSIVDDLGAKTDTRFTVILPDGKVVGDSKEDPAVMENHRNRPEILKALDGDTGSSIRYSHTLSRDFMYVAVPLKSADGIEAVIRSSVPIVSITEHLAKISHKVVVAAMLIIVLAIFLSVWLSSRLSSPLKYLKNLSSRYAIGDFSHTVRFQNSVSEITGLASSLDSMAKELAGRIDLITKQKNEQEAILSSMVEGVIALDMDERIIMINQAAGAMFEADPVGVKGKLIQEAIRSSAFHKCVHDLFNRRESIASEMTTASQRILDVHGSIIRGARNNEVLGGCIVMHDVTGLKKLEQMRRDFVANVSHELRTPLTLIKGFVETLLDGATKNPAKLDRFLAIINNHVNRLNTLIEDLLTISHLEKAEQQQEVELETVPLDDVVERAIEFCGQKAAPQRISIKKSGTPGIFALLHASLFEQAVINLIDNGIKYSGENTTITISTEKQNGAVALSVADQGCGIPPEHIPRIFERFYRVDKARSRKLGGTGLGLSIVKHIVNVHKGTVKVESEIGKGSVFTIILPCPQNASASAIS